MSGADLANLVNEAALHAVRRGSADIAMADFEAARDRVLMGQRRESHGALGRREGADRLPRGRPRRAGLRARARRPGPQGHHPARPAWPSASPSSSRWRSATSTRASTSRTRCACAWAAACAELLVYGDLSTGAANDLVGNTELARKMVREWGMSDAIGPMAWGSQGQVFLGEDLMHTRDYSEHTSQIIDDEVERILRAQEQRALEVLSQHRGGLDAVARALLDNETIDGAEVARLVDEAHGSPVHGEGAKSVPHFHEAAITPAGRQRRGNGANGAGNGHAPHAERRHRRGRPEAPTPAGAGPAPSRPRRRPAGPTPRRGLPRRGPRRPTPRPAPRRAPAPARHGAHPGSNRSGPRASEGGWWSTSSQTGSRRATSPPSARPA